MKTVDMPLSLIPPRLLMLADLLLADLLLAALTSVFVALILLYFWLSGEEPVSPLPVNAFSVALLGSLLLLNTLANIGSRLPAQRDSLRPSHWLTVALVSALLLNLLIGMGIVQILWLLVIAQLPRYFSWRWCLLAALLVPLLLALVHGSVLQQEYALLNAGLYILFNLFALYICFTLQSEREAREYASQLVRELRATQQLLSSASERDERLRIARELHDLVGHHLAALSIQLEIARHTREGAREHAIERAGTIAHLLLSDVREAVSDFRERKGLDLRGALISLLSSLPRPQIWLQLPPDLLVDDVAQAETLLRAVQEALTNVLRHSAASRVAIAVQQDDERLQLVVMDNGGLQQLPLPANGLSGMCERAQALGGNCDWQLNGHGLTLRLSLPVNDLTVENGA